MPTLATATVTFQTGDDDKRKESSLDVTVRDKTGDIIASVQDAFGLFDNNTINGPFDLEVLNPVERSAVKPGGTVVLSWQPWKDLTLGSTDEWHFSMNVDLAFSDGEHVAVQEDGLRLTASQATLQFGM
jgi:hypothetical protein